MNIHYRIVRVDPAAHGIVIRYFTDNVTENDLANSFNEDGSVKLNADGYPVSTRTDIQMSIYDTPAPSQEEIEKRIMLNAPVEWLKLQEDIKNPNVDTKMKDVRKLVGESKSFSLDQLTSMKTAIIDTENSEQSIVKAHDVVINLRDSLKILITEDPDTVESLVEVVEEVKKTLNL